MRLRSPIARLAAAAFLSGAAASIVGADPQGWICDNPAQDGYFFNRFSRTVGTPDVLIIDDECRGAAEVGEWVETASPPSPPESTSRSS